MKKVLAIILTFTIFSATTALACEGHSPYPFSGDSEILNRIVPGSISCSVDGVESDATLGEFAIYRCINSPTYHLLRFGENRIIARSVEAIDENSFKVLAHKSERSTLTEVTCRFKQEAPAPTEPGPTEPTPNEEHNSHEH